MVSSGTDVTPELAVEGFRANARLDGTELAMDLVGTLDYIAVEPFEGFVANMLRATAESEITTATVDVRNLEFMNSSGFKVLITWITSVKDAASGRRHRIHFLSDPKRTWQKRTLASLQYFANDLVSVATDHLG